MKDTFLKNIEYSKVPGVFQHFTSSEIYFGAIYEKRDWSVIEEISSFTVLGN